MNRRGFLAVLVGAPVACAAAVCGRSPVDAKAGFAAGGKFAVRGGDRVPFCMMMEPGEVIEISCNRAALRPLAEALIPHINEAMRDGHNVKLLTT